jgi:hypothetical protein
MGERRLEIADGGGRVTNDAWIKTGNIESCVAQRAMQDRHSTSNEGGGPEENAEVYPANPVHPVQDFYLSPLQGLPGDGKESPSRGLTWQEVT